MSKILHTNNIASLAVSATDILTQALISVLEEKEHAIFALPGGRSVIPLFTELTRRETVDWSRVHIFIVDERLVSLDNPESNYHQARELLFLPLFKKGLLKNNVHPFIFTPSILDKGTTEYTEKLLTLGGKYDILLLSAGEDGHVAGLYPSHHSIRDENSYFITFNDSPKPPAERMSSSRKLLSETQWVVTIFSGESKYTAFKRYQDPTLSVVDCPVKITDTSTHGFVLTTYAQTT